MDTTSGIWGAVALAIATFGSVLVARTSRPPKDEQAPTVAELSTIAGLAQQMVRLNGRVTELEAEALIQRERTRQQEATIGALRRYSNTLKGALRTYGATVPEPDPADAPYLA
jgi:hypothetical protein